MFNEGDVFFTYKKKQKHEIEPIELLYQQLMSAREKEKKELFCKNFLNCRQNQ